MIFSYLPSLRSRSIISSRKFKLRASAIELHFSGAKIRIGFTRSPIHPFPIHSFAHSLIHSLSHSPIHSFTHSLIHSFTHCLQPQRPHKRLIVRFPSEELPDEFDGFLRAAAGEDDIAVA